MTEVAHRQMVDNALIQTLNAAQAICCKNHAENETGLNVLRSFDLQGHEKMQSGSSEYSKVLSPAARSTRALHSAHAIFALD